MAVCRYAVIRASSPTTARASSADPVADAADRSRFVEASRRMPARIRLFCLTLRWSGARISEVLALTPPRSISRAALRAFRTLMRRKRGIVRQVPLPPNLLRELDRVFRLRIAQRDPELATLRLWRWSRTTAWRYVKSVMAGAGYRGHTRHAEGFAARLRRQRPSVRRSTASRSTLAWPRVAADDGNLRRCGRTRGAVICRADVDEA